MLGSTNFIRLLYLSYSKEVVIFPRAMTDIGFPSVATLYVTVPAGAITDMRFPKHHMIHIKEIANLIYKYYFYYLHVCILLYLPHSS